MVISVAQHYCRQMLIVYTRLYNAHTCTDGMCFSWVQQLHCRKWIQRQGRSTVGSRQWAQFLILDHVPLSQLLLTESWCIARGLLGSIHFKAGVVTPNLFDGIIVHPNSFLHAGPRTTTTLLCLAQ